MSAHANDWTLRDGLVLFSFDTRTSAIHWTRTLPSTRGPVSPAVLKPAIHTLLTSASLHHAFLQPPEQTAHTDTTLTVALSDSSIILALPNDAPEDQQPAKASPSRYLALIVPKSTHAGSGFSVDHPLNPHLLPSLQRAALFLTPEPSSSHQLSLRCLFDSLSTLLVNDHGWGARTRAASHFLSSLLRLANSLETFTSITAVPPPASVDTPAFRDAVAHFTSTVAGQLAKTQHTPFCIFTPDARVAFSHSLLPDDTRTLHWFFTTVLNSGDRRRHNNLLFRHPCGTAFLWYRHRNWLLLLHIHKTPAVLQALVISFRTLAYTVLQQVLT